MATLPDLAPDPTRQGQPDKLYDSHGRQITDLRVSITDRCNYKCVYCRTGNVGAQFAELKTEDYLRLIRNFVALGIEKVRLTGGEPLLRKDLPEMVRELASWHTPMGEKLDLAITTNGHLLEDLAQPLKDAGLSRITISMDAAGTSTESSESAQAIFERITRVPGSYQAVLRGIRAAKEAGFQRIKINCVLLRGFNDDQVEAFAAFARRENVIVRFIEFMPLEEDRLWSPEMVVPLREIVERISKVFPLKALIPNSISETARRFGFLDDPDGLSLGEIGIIAPVTQAFCGACSRIRLTSDGKIRTCLFSNLEHDIYSKMKNGASDANLQELIVRTVEQKEARHHIGEPEFLKPSRSMVHIGG